MRRVGDDDAEKEDGDVETDGEEPHPLEKPRLVKQVSSEEVLKEDEASATSAPKPRSVTRTPPCSGCFPATGCFVRDTRTPKHGQWGV